MRRCGKPYRILLFDVDNTLLDFDASERESFGSLLKFYGFPVTESYLEEYHELNRQCWELFEEGKLDKDQVLARRFELFFSRHGREISGREADDHYRGMLADSAVLIPGAGELCEKLSKAYELYIVTNGVGQTQRKRLKDSGLSQYFKGIFISEEMGSQKPKREFFDHCLEGIRGGKKEEMLLIGDSLTSDMRGGENSGIDTCWYNPKGLENSLDVPVTFQVSSFQELEAILCDSPFQPADRQNEEK